MATSKVTIYGLDKFKSYEDASIFDSMELPDNVDKDSLVNNILMESADFEAIYADADFITEAIGIWSKKWYHTFEKWADALEISYEPLVNYDRTETHSESATSSGTSTGTQSSSQSGTSGSTTTDSVSAYNTSAFQNSGQSVISGSDSNSTSIDSSATSDDSSKKDISIRAYGNIGTVSSQAMLQAELDIARFNLIQQITDIFMKEFCVMIYL